MGHRFVVLTGASRGLGRALAEGFAVAGHTVAGCARDEAALAELAEGLGAPHDFRAVDVTSPAVEGWAAELIDRRGPPDLLINNAALMNDPEKLWRVSAEEFSRLVDVNLKGVHNVLRAFLPTMVERRRGVVVNVSSGWGRSTSPEVAPYCATKYAVEGLTGALAHELPTGMAAVALNPGVINTSMLRRVWGSSAAAYPSPAAWAERAVPFLLALDPSHNGASLTVPG